MLVGTPKGMRFVGQPKGVLFGSGSLAPPFEGEGSTFAARWFGPRYFSNRYWG